MNNNYFELDLLKDIERLKEGQKTLRDAEKLKKEALIVDDKLKFLQPIFQGIQDTISTSLNNKDTGTLLLMLIDAYLEKRMSDSMAPDQVREVKSLFIKALDCLTGQFNIKNFIS